MITTVGEVPNVIHFSEQFADTYLMLETSFCASMFFSPTRSEINICKANKELKSTFFFYYCENQHLSHSE